MTTALNPIYTEVRQCHDCYKCLRQCRVKAINIQDGHARVNPDYCILCGHCVSVCPMQAKKVRSDVERVKLLLRLRKKVILSLAPSFVAEFSGIDTGSLINGLKYLGFYGVSETALGAEQINIAVARMLQEKPGLYISSACPSVVELINRYYPQYAERICAMLSPALTHARMLRHQYGDDIGVVFAGPCIAKKKEADDNPDLLNIAITFRELRQWFEEEGIDLSAMSSGTGNDFIPTRAREGALYPIEGGMIAGIEPTGSITDCSFMTFSGIRAIQDALTDLERLKDRGPVFLELLACEGGCVNGPQINRTGATALKRYDVIRTAAVDSPIRQNRQTVPVEHLWKSPAVPAHRYTAEQIREALKRIGKFGPEDELNCGSCGYDTCRNFAEAMLDDRAEEKMCMGYIRRLASKQANALLNAMPSGVVITDETLTIIDSNRRFAEILGPDIERAYEAMPHLEGANLRKTISFADLFTQVLEKGLPSLQRDVKVESRIFHVTIFTIEKHRRVGGIIQDITAPAIQKEQIVKKAKQVITQNLQTVQKIAYLLGENASDSEVILNSIVDVFDSDTEGRTDHEVG